MPTTPKPGDTPPAQPTPAQATDIATAGATAATDPAHQTTAEREAAAQAAIQQRGDELGTRISEEDARLIANMTIQQLEARGAFDPPPPPAPVEPGPPAEPAGGEPVAPGAVPQATPAKRTFAQRFMGVE